MIYDFILLGLRPNTLGAVMPKLADAIAANSKRGKLVGCFTADFGVLNRIAVLSEYSDARALAEDRASSMESGDRFGFALQLATFERTAYAPLAFSEPIKPGKYGPFYEIRTYGIAPGGLQATSDAWSKGISRRNELSKLLAVMASMDSSPQRMLHIWPYASLDHRAATRARAGKEGIWPPPGGSDHLLSLQSELFVPTAFSPLS
ncbi:MAG TPA: NIPSNAP family protein [Xanthobacteraceae bacterium]|jgi:hypothetical protein